MKKNITIRSSAAEYLTFITASGESEIETIYADENVWMSQKMMGLLYDVEANTINYHLQKLFKSSEIEKEAVTRIFRITASDGKPYNTLHYNLKAIIAVGHRVDSDKAVQFRKWANDIIEEYTIKGFAMDDDRLKSGGTVLTKQYFEELLERIREIRLSERKFYQKITDIYATSLDYDSKSETTKIFLPLSKTGFTMLYMEILLLRSYMTERMQQKKIWDSQIGRALLIVKFINMM